MNIPHTPALNHRLLTKAEEQQLGTIIQAGITWPTPTSRTKPDPILTPSALKARDELVLHNIKLALSVAAKRGCGIMLLEDRVTLAIIGLITAANKFDPARGLRFSTAAVPWIIQSVNRGLEKQGYAIRFPAHVLEGASKARKAIAKDRQPTDKDLELLGYVSQLGRVLSSDKPIGHGDMILAETFVGESLDPSTDFISEAIKGELKQLKPIEQRLLAMVFFGGMTTTDAAKDLGLNTRRAQNMKRRALLKLRNRKAIQGAWGELVG